MAEEQEEIVVVVVVAEDYCSFSWERWQAGPNPQPIAKSVEAEQQVVCF